MNCKIIESFIEKEKERQEQVIELIASENVVSDDVLEAIGSVFTNKYSEGYPEHWYYPGNEVVEEMYLQVCEWGKRLFGNEYINVLPHSGTTANRAVVEAVCNIGDTIVALNLNDGGHLSHSSKASFIGKYYNVIPYHVTSEGFINYDEIATLAKTYHPKLIIAGASAYSRTWVYPRLRSIANECGAILMFDMAHIAGLVAAGVQPNPCEYADIVTSTTHKTLRGPRHAFITMRKDFEYEGKMMSKRIDSSVFPGNQGGPLMNIITGVGVCFYEALQPEFIDYQRQVVKNAQTLATTLKDNGFFIVSGGTDNHSFLVDLRTKYPEMTGAQAEEVLAKNHIIVNRNMVPNDTRKPKDCSGLRFGTPAVTSREFDEEDMCLIGEKITKILDNYYENSILK